MANSQNLIPNEARTPEERRENARKAGKASGVARAKKRTMKQQLELLMSLDIVKEKLKEQLKALGIPDDQLTNQMAMNVAMFNQALKGNVRAFEVLQQTLEPKFKNGAEEKTQHKVEIVDDLPDNES